MKRTTVFERVIITVFAMLIIAALLPQQAREWFRERKQMPTQEQHVFGSGKLQIRQPDSTTSPGNFIEYSLQGGAFANAPLLQDGNLSSGYSYTNPDAGEAVVTAMIDLGPSPVAVKRITAQYGETSSLGGFRYGHNSTPTIPALTNVDGESLDVTITPVSARYWFVQRYVMSSGGSLANLSDVRLYGTDDNEITPPEPVAAEPITVAVLNNITVTMTSEVAKLYETPEVSKFAIDSAHYDRALTCQAENASFNADALALLIAGALSGTNPLTIAEEATLELPEFEAILTNKDSAGEEVILTLHRVRCPGNALKFTRTGFGVQGFSFEAFVNDDNELGTWSFPAAA